MKIKDWLNSRGRSSSKRLSDSSVLSGKSSGDEEVNAFKDVWKDDSAISKLKTNKVHRL